MIVDDWIAEKIGLPDGEALTREALEAWQLARLRETLSYAAARSSFYRERLTEPGLHSSFDGSSSAVDHNNFRSLRSLSDAARLPFTTPRDLAEEGIRMVCIPASQVDRIVTLPTTGTTGPPKRVWFTGADQELMIDYIHHGLPVMTGPGDVFLVLMPCERPGSVGELVAAGVERIGSRALRVGAIPADGSRDGEALEIMRREGVTTGLATAPTAARLAAKSAGDAVIAGNMRTILLSAQFISDADRRVIEAAWGCKAYEHYGMTEMGLGGAMACEVRAGYHPREADLLFEIIDPDTGEVLPEGEYGEIVFTTLTRRAMPLIRYRTGDFSRWIPGRCPCGSVLKRLGKVADRAERKDY
ncbi:MAG: AMP-binding protein [Clostridiales Family XIII bacterium]|jgi:phenylacetate-coenzyme A ligase PaaK-like adenylate-forming protein|nr:AMP-binding protein [Clostridiales Family XIII bacterium]